VEGDLIHPVTGQPRDAAVVVAELLDHVQLALAESGETEAVAVVVGDILSGGTGAATQRRAAQAAGSLAGMVAQAVARTHRLPGEVPPEEVLQEPMRY
jgi:carboxylate-amine ligase